MISVSEVAKVLVAIYEFEYYTSRIAPTYTINNSLLNFYYAEALVIGFELGLLLLFSKLLLFFKL